MEVVVITITATITIDTTTILLLSLLLRLLLFLKLFFLNLFYGQNEVQVNVIFCSSKFITPCSRTPDGCCGVLAPVPSHYMFRHYCAILR